MCAHTERALLICGRCAAQPCAFIRDRLAEGHDRCRDSKRQAGRKGRLQIVQAALEVNFAAGAQHVLAARELRHLRRVRRLGSQRRCGGSLGAAQEVVSSMLGLRGKAG